MRQMLRGEFNDLIVTLAKKDPEFRQLLFANPREALAKVLQMPLPESVSVTLVEEAPDTIHLILPSKIPATSELSDSQLAQVSGGNSGPWVSDTWGSLVFAVRPAYLTPIQIPQAE